MRRYSLGLIVLIAAVLAMPASGRGFRTDQGDCSSSDMFTECWGGGPSGAVPVLPIGLANGVLGTDFFINSTVDPTNFPRENFSTANFFLIAFDYQLFWDVQHQGSSSIVTAPFPTYYYGLHRPAPSVPTAWSASDAPLFRIDWEFDPVFLGGMYPDIFLPFGFSNDRIGVQLIFGLDDPAGFQLNGLVLSSEGYTYSYSRTAVNGDLIWGREDPCDTFNNLGLCTQSEVPEPSSFALLGLGFLAMVVGLRTGRSAPARLA